jgi:hypothetical protein
MPWCIEKSRPNTCRHDNYENITADPVDEGSIYRSLRMLERLSYEP